MIFSASLLGASDKRYRDGALPMATKLPWVGIKPDWDIKMQKSDLHSVSGIEMMTPLPVPTHSRLQAIISAVMRTKENPSFPVPEITGF